MKFLLTSTGLTNKKLMNKFIEMVGKRPEEMIIAYIPTAAIISPQPHKKWMIENLIRLNKMGIKNIDIVDFSAIPKENWLPRFERADVIFVEGGMPGYLKEKMEEANLIELFNTTLSEKVYVGCSAGSNVIGEIIIKSSKEDSGYKSEEGFALVDFSIRPHYFRFDRLQFTDEIIAQFAKDYNSTFYAIDDESGITVENGTLEVISEGKWKKFEK